MMSRFAVIGIVAGLLAAQCAAADDVKDKTRQVGKPDQTAGDQGQGSQAGQETARKYLQQQDKNNDGSLSRDELPAGLRDGFQDIDANRDGKLTAGELSRHAVRMNRHPMPVEVVSVWVVEADTDPPTKQDLQSAYDMLRKVDGNGDGQIGQDELRAARDRVIQDRVDAVFKQCDKNSDGKIAKDECRGPTDSAFSRVDANSDGFVDRQELKSGYTPQAAGRKGQPSQQEQQGGKGKAQK